MDLLQLFQMVATLGAIVATIFGAQRVVQVSPPGKRWPATALAVGMLLAVLVIPISLGIATGLGHAPPPKLTRALLLAAQVAVIVAGVALRMRYGRR